MTFLLKKIIFINILAISLGFLWAGQAYAVHKKTDMRTSNRKTIGIDLSPKPIFQLPEHYRFSPNLSNWDSETMHPEAFYGQDWDKDKWGSGWTPKRAVKNFFKSGIFIKQYLKSYKKTIRLVDKKRRHFFAIKKKKKYVPVLELGPVFYQLSDQDQRRSLQLVAEQSNILSKTYQIIVLVDWKTKEIIGSYSNQGMFLN